MTGIGTDSLLDHQVGLEDVMAVGRGPGPLLGLMTGPPTILVLIPGPPDLLVVLVGVPAIVVVQVALQVLPTTTHPDQDPQTGGMTGGGPLHVIGMGIEDGPHPGTERTFPPDHQLPMVHLQKTKCVCEL